MIILGVSPYHADASAAIVVDGKLVAAVEEERFSRIKHTAGFPSKSVLYCLNAAGIHIREVDHIAIPRNPLAHLMRKMFYAARIPRFAFDRFRALRHFNRTNESLAETLEVDLKDINARFHRVEHHLSHIASAFFVSPFERAVVLSLDGLGDFSSSMWGVGEGNKIRISGRVAFPHSLGLYYTALTQYLGFWKYGDEYKVMGLGAYGQPEYLSEFRDIVRNSHDIGYTQNLRYFNHHRAGLTITWEDGEPQQDAIYSPYLERRFGKARETGQPIQKKHKNIAASLQKRLEEVFHHQLNALHDAMKRENDTQIGLTNLAYAGGVAFNCVANGTIFDRTPFEKLYIQPAAGDAGLAIGAAFYVWNQILKQPRGFVMEHAYWGPEFSDSQLLTEIKQHKMRYSRLEEEPLVQETARHIAEGKVVGWFQGRMEWGPRALGNRSIIVDPRRADMRDILNSRIKHREPFRPFSPSVLEEYTNEYFERTHPSPFMQLALRVLPEKRPVIPAPTHVDGTARLHTVSRKTNPRYWQLINAFYKQTGVPVVLNTSFNENEPIVCGPAEAINCFLRTKMDVLAIGNYLIQK